MSNSQGRKIRRRISQNQVKKAVGQNMQNINALAEYLNGLKDVFEEVLERLDRLEEHTGCPKPSEESSPSTQDTTQDGATGDQTEPSSGEKSTDTPST